MSLFSKKTTPDNAARYTAESGELSYTQLRAASWYARHKEQVWHVVEICLLAWCVVTVGFSFVYGLYYGAYGYWQDRKAIEDHAATFIDYTALQQFYAPLSLRMSDIRLIRYDNGKTDAVVEVENPNEDFVVHVTYTYTDAGVYLPEQTVVLLPKQRSVLPALGLTNVSSIGFNIVEEKWRRVSSQRIPDPIAYMADRFDVDVQNITVEQATGVVPFNNVSFTLTNRSAFGYKELDVFAVLRSGSVIVGVVPLSFESFVSGGVERVDIRQVVGVGEPDSVDIVPRINVFDASVFLPIDDEE